MLCDVCAIDEVFRESATNATVFDRAARNIVDSCVEGFNGKKTV